MSTKYILSLLAALAVCLCQAPADSITNLDAPQSVTTFADQKSDPLYTIAKGTILVFCQRMQTEHNVNVKLDDVLTQGTHEDAIRFADTLSEFAAQGLLENFMRDSAPKMREKYGPVRK